MPNDRNVFQPDDYAALRKHKRGPIFFSCLFLFGFCSVYTIKSVLLTPFTHTQLYNLPGCSTELRLISKRALRAVWRTVAFLRLQNMWAFFDFFSSFLPASRITYFSMCSVHRSPDQILFFSYGNKMKAPQRVLLIEVEANVLFPWNFLPPDPERLCELVVRPI